MESTGEPNSHVLLQEGATSELVNALQTVAQMLKLLNAIINAALVLVDVSPGGPRSAKRGDIASGGLRDSIEANEHV
jgi:hypothetical protein